MDLGINWNFGIQFDNQVKPTYCYYDQAQIGGSARVKDLDDITLARLEDGGKETITTLFTDSENGGNTISNSLSNCWVRGMLEGSEGVLNFSQVA